MEKHQPVIVIGRSFGSGGRSVGKELARELNLAYYDKELLIKAAKELGFSDEIFARADEKKPSFLKRLATRSYGVQETFTPDTLSPESLYEAQSKAIKAVADKGGCVIVGRTADYILRDFPGLFSIYLHAPLAYRAKKIMERGDADNLKSAEDLARKKDRERESYYKYFTGRQWGVASNYHLAVDASRISIPKLAQIISRFLSEK